MLTNVTFSARLKCNTCQLQDSHMESILGFGATGQSLARALDQAGIEYRVITRTQADLRNRAAALQALQGSKVGYITLGLPGSGIFRQCLHVRPRRRHDG